MATEAERETLREQHKNRIATMAQLRFDNLLDDLPDADISLIETMVERLVSGELPTTKWRSVLTNLRSRRALLYPAPKIERRHGPSGW